MGCRFMRNLLNAAQAAAFITNEAVSKLHYEAFCPLIPFHFWEKALNLYHIYT
jgi:hypothetical protein